jgi:hypothetical protein
VGIGRIKADGGEHRFGVLIGVCVSSIELICMIICKISGTSYLAMNMSSTVE